MNIETIIYLLLILGFFLLESFSRARRKKRKQESEVPDSNPTDPMEDDNESQTLEEWMQEEQASEQPELLAETKEKADKTKREPTALQQKMQEYAEKEMAGGAEEEVDTKPPESVIEATSVDKQEDLSASIGATVTTDEAPDSRASHFDLEDAIIYDAILHRKY